MTTSMESDGLPDLGLCVLLSIFLYPSHSSSRISFAYDSHFSQLPRPRFPWGSKSGLHKRAVSFKQILLAALQ